MTRVGQEAPREGSVIMRLRGKLGLVSAAASGMGRAGAIRFAEEGAAVAVADIDRTGVEQVVSEIEKAGGRAIGITADLGQDEEARRIVTETVAAFGGLDFVWNHVGHPGPHAFEGIDMEAYRIAMDLNLRSVLVTSEAAIPHLRKRGGGALLFTSSVSGLMGSPLSPVYSAAKFGVIGLVRALAKRYAPENIRVNAICPGPIDTPMLRVFVARPDQPSSESVDAEALAAEAARYTPMRRTGIPREIANAALFLLSDEASYVSGVALPVDGAASA